MGMSFTNRYRVLAVAAVAVTTVAIHYGVIFKPSHGDLSVFHAIHARLCYIPIILGAIWFGVRGGLAVAFAIVIATLPYAIWLVEGPHSSPANEYTEMILSSAIGLTAGTLIELQRRERKRREALSNELARERHLASLGQMAAGLAHEIKNPLGSIKGSAEILGDDFPPESRKHDLLKVLVQETDRLNRVVEDFLTFARPRPIERKPTQVNALVRDVLSQIDVVSSTRGVRVASDLDPELPAALLDGEKLHQVFLNLALNALSAMPEGGTLTVETRSSSRESTRHIIATFRDEGTGILPEDLDRIFDPFFTRSEKGTGLGLSISHTIVKNHGGRIDVAANQPKGSAFSVILPVIEE
jgi:two-component system sensor histidine kinase HydH